MWLVRAIPREGHDGRNRSGRRFLVAHPTMLQDDEMTPDILADPLLVCESVVPREIEIAVAGSETDLSQVSLDALAVELERRGYWLFPVEVTAEEADAFIRGDETEPDDAGDEPEGEAPAPEVEQPQGAAGAPAEERPQCAGTNKRGERCKAKPLPDSDRCGSHPAEA